jgi:uncharacterized membrane protein YhhN
VSSELLTALTWALCAGFAALDWYAVARGDRRTETWAKPATLIALTAAAVAMDAPDSPAGRWLLVALLFGLLGDVFLLGTSTARFQAGLAAFLVGHLAYLGCFLALGLDHPAWAAVGVAVAAVALASARQVLPSTQRSGGPALSVPVAVYMLVITAMVVLAWATGVPLVALGASVFVTSDTVLAVNRFVRPLPRASVVVMVTYHVGQALIVLGVLAR